LSQQIGAELHVESKRLAHVGKALPSILPAVQREMPEATFDPNWSKGLGRIHIRKPSGDTADIVHAMLRLIETTRPEVDRLLGHAVKQS
jgi:hypothetical protein